MEGDLERKIAKRVEIIKERVDNKETVAQAVGLALNEAARGTKLGDENVNLISNEVRSALHEYDSEDKQELMDDLKLIARDTAEEFLIRFGFDQPELFSAFNEAFEHYLSEVLKEKTQ